MNDINNRERLLKQAIEMVNGGREQDYGAVEDNFKRIADAWSTYLRNRVNPGHALNGTDVALMMVLFKMSRLQVSPDHRDSWVDMAGYAACGGGLNFDDDSMEKL